ncbi:DNA polymerase, beta domain protein region [Leptothrix cholodnii SP-6]|uniref:DNA polymerase, beta domain protein region n=1 Tax=Leptothrix cholodnii (strain ATCC 51168 / LMG 8142 / SP-6) TaxID=395495 RepID=B1Y475_LEPCP|nr:nucleotidyltransferase domain-containing protein [Leptothrix cholodnii]ACB34597.1 DNA polymerase, beta domain protein region [Leptothrix cholodnii SP-6]
MHGTDPIETAIANHPELETVLLFGSLAQGRARADSDVDIAVQARHALSAEEKMALIADLADTTGRAVDLVDLRTVGEPLLGQILAHGRRIRGSDAAYAALISRHVFDNEDFMPYVRRMLAERRKAWIG